MLIDILISICILWCLSLNIKNTKRKNENILLAKEYKKLSDNYDKLCDVLAGDINVENVKKKLEGKIEQKALISDINNKLDTFPLSIKQVNILREYGKKENNGAIYKWEKIKSAILSYTLMGSGKCVYIIVNDKAWEILDDNSHPVLKKWSLFTGDAHVQIILDPLQVKEILNANE